MKLNIKLETIEINQEKAVRRKLKTQHLLLLDYLCQFFSSGYAKFVVKGKKKFYYITLNKILSDLPILGIKKRRLQELIAELTNLKLIERYTNRCSPNIFIRLSLSSIIM